ncbi:hypothetical protein B2K_10215 [Paenibacillus mucilaginosus K02]|uniref:Uncharacterized protein n=1 Tax=Paenibacillus mucilaginosus K02 TaxID=997761 RepID=I0BFE6_9BACL|nr:hypothetical protein B2K_10215 [Paenibacillus mucilaginosus K02]
MNYREVNLLLLNFPLESNHEYPQQDMESHTQNQVLSFHLMKRHNVFFECIITRDQITFGLVNMFDGVLNALTPAFILGCISFV